MAAFDFPSITNPFVGLPQGEGTLRRAADIYATSKPAAFTPYQPQAMTPLPTPGEITAQNTAAIQRAALQGSPSYSELLAQGLGTGSGGPFTEEQHRIYGNAMASKFGNAPVPTAAEFALLSPLHRQILQSQGFPYGG